MQTKGVHHLAILVKDLETVTAFYRDDLGLKELTRHLHDDGSLRSVWLDAGGAFLAIEKAPESDEPSTAEDRAGHHLLALRIDASARKAIEQELAAKGIAVERASRWTLYLRDPEGNRLGLSHHPEDP